MSDIDLNDIRRLDGALLLTLRELLRERSTTRAAERLGLSQSAVSHALSRLRELFGDPLFVRQPHGLEPTRHALELAPRIDALLDAMGEALGLTHRFEPSTSTRGFRIAAPDHVATLLAPGLLARFAAQAPEARFAFSQRLGQDALEAVTREEIDLALGRFRRPDPAVALRPVLQDRYCLIARRRHPRLRGKLTRRGYAELDHVLVSVGGDFQSLELAPPTEAVPPRRTVAAVPRFLMAFPLVAASDAVATVPARLAAVHGDTFGVSAHPLPFATEPIRVMAAHKPHLDPGIRWLLEQLEAAVSAP